MLANLIENVKISLQPMIKYTRTEEIGMISLANIPNVLSTVPGPNRNIQSIYKEGQFLISKKHYGFDSDICFIFEWIPVEGYYSRFSKRKFSSSKELDIFNSCTTNEEQDLKNQAHNPANFWQIFRTSTNMITQIKLIWTDWKKDLGYIIIKDIDLLSKRFCFQESGLRNIDSILQSHKFKRTTNSEEFYKIVYNIKKINWNSKSPIFIPNSNIPFYRSLRKKREIDVYTYEGFFNEHGQMEDIFNFKRLTFYFGLHRCIRKEAWKFLLGFYTFSSTPEERFTLCDISEQGYKKLNFDRLHLKEGDQLKEMLTNIELTIDKDVNRTDRNNPFYSGYQNKNLKTLKNILLNYCYSRPHIGYTQGMTDLLAPLLQVLNSESEAFWCFIEFVENNYCAIFPNNENMDHVTKTLRELIHFLLPDIYLLISSHDCDVLLIFTHRWFLLCFQREFESEDVFKIWEACWSNQYCSLGYFQFFVALSILFCYHEINEMGTSIFSSSTDEALIFFSQNAFYDCDAILKCSQILLKAFRKSDKIPCSLRCFLDYKIGGGWEISSKSQIECTCLKHRNSCIYKSVSISENMNILVSRASCRIDIESIRTDYHQSSQEEDNRVFEK